MTEYIDKKISKIQDEIKNIVLLKELEKKKSEIDIKKDKEINLSIDYYVKKVTRDTIITGICKNCANEFNKTFDEE